MLVLSSPLLLTAPVLQADLSNSHHNCSSSGSHNLNCASEPELFYSYRHSLSFAQLNALQAVENVPISSTSEPPKIEDFISLSVGLLVIYWIGNFVVPEFIAKKLYGPEVQKQEAGGDSKQRILEGLQGSPDDKGSDMQGKSPELTSIDDSTFRGRGFGKFTKQAPKTKKVD
ncbi:hypothetical protein KP509_34G026700 [Ceratopteris richardii]|uniref:Uncharacterized protein n=1 Tax=Ceratopteris richardii TaxID=49495 RepID=A0A8T2QJT5_CERRI|nr:hypothetical protein KP509_34G026700 [Ceratopteris richardii]